MSSEKDYRTPKHWKLAGKDAVNEKDLLSFLQELVAWGRDVRLDIVRLEGAVGLPPGDPGDPPPPPE